MSTDNTGDTPATGDVAALQAKIAELESKHTQAILERDGAKARARELEQAGKGPDPKLLENALTEATTWKTKYESLNTEYGTFKTQYTDEKITQALSTALGAAGAKSVSTVLKVVDKSAVKLDDKGQIVASSIEELVKAVKESDPILFGEAEVPNGQAQSTTTGGSSSKVVLPVKPAGEGQGTSAFDAAIAEAQKKGDMKAIQRLYKEAMQPKTH